MDDRTRTRTTTPRGLLKRRSRSRGLVATIAIAFAVIVAIVIGRTIAASGAAPITPLGYQVPAIDSSAAAAHLSTALQFETISYDDRSSPQALEALRNWLADTYPRLHAVAHRTIVGEGTLLYEWAGRDAQLQPIILMAHQDAVPAAEAERWKHPPFSGAIAEGAIWGRGALDNKSALIAIMEAAESLVISGHAPERTVFFVFGHDEESGGAGARAAAELLASRGVKAAFVLDEGGVSLTADPLTGQPISLIGVAEKGYVTLELSVKSAGGHSNAPGNETAVDTLAQALIAIREHPFPARYEGVTKATIEGLAPRAPFVTRMAIANSWLLEPLLLHQLTASPQGAATVQTTIAPTMLQGSAKQNVLPSVATATINLRILPGDSIESVIAHVREALGDLPVSIATVGPRVEPSRISSTESDGYRLVSRAAAAVINAPVAPLLVTGVTDSRHMRLVSDDIYRFQPVMLDQADVALAHGLNERVSLENFDRMLALYQQVIVGGSAREPP